MQIKLIQGDFNITDAIALISELISVKIKFHENAISNSSNEEDIKYRESRIKDLQNELNKWRKEILSSSSRLNIEASISIN